MISVIVPVYNSDKYLSDCIDSILNQTYEDFELILVDDGSADNSGKICDIYAIKDARIKVFHKENGGVSYARNIGLKAATGDYIQFIDSDDYIKENFLQILHDSIIKNNSQISVCKATTVSIKGFEINSKSKVTKDICLGRDEAANFIFNEMNNALWNKLISKDIIKDICFEENRTFGEDPYFLVQVLNNCSKVSFVPDELYYYRKNDESITSTKFSERKFDQVYFKDKMYEYMCQNFPDLIDLSNKWRFTSRLNICRMLCLTGNDKKYEAVFQEYKLFMKEHYIEIKGLLSKKENMEYKVFKMGIPIYSFFVKMIFKR